MCSLLAEHSRVLAGNHDLGPIDLIAQIDPDRSNRRGITQTESNGVREVVKFVRAIVNTVLWIVSAERKPGICGLEYRCGGRPPERHVTDRAVGISSVVKEGAAQPGRDKRHLQRKTQLLIDHEQSLSADGETRNRVARASLIERKSP